jgi:hypothetical protein
MVVMKLEAVVVVLGLALLDGAGCGERTDTSGPISDEPQEVAASAVSASESDEAGGRPAPWLVTSAHCVPETTSIYFTGLISDMTTGEASCSRQVVACSDKIRTDWHYNYKDAKCPWSDQATISRREDGAVVCCAAWDEAKRSKSPCDPLADADCDGIPNVDDLDTLAALPPALPPAG